MDEIELGPLERSWGTATQASPVSSCLTAAEWIEFVDRGESADFYSRAILHLAQCLECRMTVQEMRAADQARTIAESSTRMRLPFLGLLKPLTLLGAAATLALGSAIVLIKLNSNKTSKPDQSPTGVVARSSHAPHTASTNLGNRPSPANRKASPTPIPGSVASNTSVVATQSGPGGHPTDIDDPSAPATDQQYCLIGSDGVFTMPSPDFKLKDRRKIEETYADRVDLARKHYDAKTEADPDDATAQLNGDLESAAEERDAKLATIYRKRDDALDKPLNLKLEAGAPYQVVEVDYKVRRRLKQPVRVVVHQPWPGYSPKRRPYGWDYEKAYEPTEFKSRYVDWRKSYVAAGRPAFCGLVGRTGAVQVDTIYGSRYEGYAASREIARHRATFENGLPRFGGYSHSSDPSEGQAPHTWSGYTHSAAPGAQSGTQLPANPNGYTHSRNGSTPSSGYVHSQRPAGGESPQAGVRSTPSIGGYTHSNPNKGRGYSKGATNSRGYFGSRNQGQRKGASDE